MERPSTIGELLRQAVEPLRQTVDCDPRLEAELLLAHLLQQPRTHLLAWPEKTVAPDLQKRFERLLQRRQAGEPLAYLTGSREFWSLSFTVTPATLIPRPETELLVERALRLIPANAAWDIADLGTGCGAIAASIASERPGCRLLATDRSAEALLVARKNFQRLGLSNVRCASGDWCQALPAETAFELIVGNPPYIAEDDPHLQSGGLPWEPTSALKAGHQGLSDLRRIIGGAPQHLRSGGWLLLEHGLQQGARVRQLMRDAGYLEVATHRDLAARERLTEGRRPPPGA